MDPVELFAHGCEGRLGQFLALDDSVELDYVLSSLYREPPSPDDLPKSLLDLGVLSLALLSPPPRLPFSLLSRCASSLLLCSPLSELFHLNAVDLRPRRHHFEGLGDVPSFPPFAHVCRP